MSLKKTIVSGIGITSQYHRISSISRDEKGLLSVGVKSYSDSTYRDKEKEFLEAKRTINDRSTRISELMAKKDDITDDEKTELEELVAKNNEVVSKRWDTTFNVSYQSIVISYGEADNDEISFSKCYELLKSTDEFKDAEDC